MDLFYRIDFILTGEEEVRSVKFNASTETDLISKANSEIVLRLQAPPYMMKTENIGYSVQSICQIEAPVFDHVKTWQPDPVLKSEKEIGDEKYNSRELLNAQHLENAFSNLVRAMYHRELSKETAG